MNADEYSARHFGAATFAAFDPRNEAHREAAAALRERLVAIGFRPDRAGGLFGLADVADVRATRTAYYDALVLPHDAAGAAARFFVLHEPQTEDELRTWLGDAGVDLLRAMAALVAIEGRLRSLVSASWFAGALIFADARAYNVFWPREPFPDYVMPPGGDSVGLQRVAPRAPRNAALDICCGAGAQALAAAAYCKHVTGVDVNPRALRFARFNAALNRIDHAEFVLSDVYEALGKARFDTILANPPFVPWPPGDDDLLYRGGGASGDDVVRRILAGAVTRLEPGGALTIVADLANVASLAERIAHWQGETRRTLILVQRHYELLEYAESHAAHRRRSGGERQAETVRLLQHFERVGINSLDFGYIVQDGMPGPALLQRTGAMLYGAISADAGAWFAHQRRLLAGHIEDARLALAPELRLVDIAERAPDGTVSMSCYAAPGPVSIHENTAVSRGAFAVLMRVAAGGLRVRDIHEPDAARELVPLLVRGLVRCE